ncbi:DUF4330 domain-containing protein [Cyanobium sp. Morenito 9A2]|uniref:DUF4330 domain-containing protein n=1 Tax=Cyanobium sp. Morenito 9A2 TaxID=2823718 RepID=UPI0020CD1D7A|nr:DUF4330 domain-containing protein [Cyanobium sp. Morenito 9A2]MCP9850078.1 DUF4330 domain-containing protein [Cyanobium sp. Morenito 9A2]
MAASHSNGRSIGWVDIGAGAAVLLALVGVIWSPKLSGAVAKATGALKPVTVTVDVRGIPAADPATLIAGAKGQGSLQIVIRNQPHGRVTVKDVIPLPRRISTITPAGRVITVEDPNQKVFSTLDARFVLEGQGQLTKEGVEFGGQGLKVGTPIELDDNQFRVSGTVTSVKVGS